MIRNILRWYRENRRAEKLGWTFRDSITGRRVYYWHDSETGKMWMSTGRYPLFGRCSLPDNRSAQSREAMLEHLERLPQGRVLVDDAA